MIKTYNKSYRLSNPLSSVQSDDNKNMPRILVVDDRQENLVATRRILKKLDVEIVLADSGNKALSLLLEDNFALVLLDVQMPEMDGFEVARIMKEEDTTRDIPIIFITAINKHDSLVDNAAEIGAADYIFKPVNPNILRSKVKVYVDLYNHKNQLIEMNKELQKTNEELERFAYICSHDLQEPARMMGYFSEMLNRKYRDRLDEKGNDYLNFIHTNAQAMQKMINDILVFSRIGYDSIEFEEVDTDGILDNILHEMSHDIKEAGADIRIISPLPVLNSNATLLNLLFKNLIGNSIKFHRTDTPIEISINAEETEDHWLFSVTDNGIGIDPKFEYKIFEVFQRIHSRHEFPGTGIGLCTCKKFIELYDGKIWFESSYGSGTTFYFTIPHKQETDNHGD